MTEEDMNEELLDKIYVCSMRIHSYIHVLHAYTDQEQENSVEVFNIHAILMLCIEEIDKIFDLYHKTI